MASLLRVRARKSSLLHLPVLESGIHLAGPEVDLDTHIADIVNVILPRILNG